MKVLVGVAAVVLIVVAVFLLIGLQALILSWAWGLVIPSVFGGPTLDIGAAFALMIVLYVIGGVFRGLSRSG